MADDRPLWAEQLDKIAHSNWVRFGTPLLVCIWLAATASIEVGLTFLVFFLVVWAMIICSSAVLWMTAKLYPKHLTEPSREKLQGAVGATMFLGAYALLGSVLRGDNLVSEAVAPQIPGGVNFEFIDPTFAMIIIIGFWVYTVMALLKGSDKEQGDQG